MSMAAEGDDQPSMSPFIGMAGSSFSPAGTSKGSHGGPSTLTRPTTPSLSGGAASTSTHPKTLSSSYYSSSMSISQPSNGMSGTSSTASTSVRSTTQTVPPTETLRTSPASATPLDTYEKQYTGVSRAATAAIVVTSFIAVLSLSLLFFFRQRFLRRQRVSNHNAYLDSGLDTPYAEHFPMQNFPTGKGDQKVVMEEDEPRWWSGPGPQVVRERSFTRSCRRTPSGMRVGDPTIAELEDVYLGSERRS